MPGGAAHRRCVALGGSQGSGPVLRVPTLFVDESTLQIFTRFVALRLG